MLVASRFLEGPNLYFPRPAVKATFDITALLALPEPDALAVARAVGLRGGRPGEPDSGFRALFAARLLTRCVRKVAARGGKSRVAVRTRQGEQPGELVVAVPWRHAGRVEVFCEGLGHVVEAMGEGPDALLAAMARAGDELAAAPLGRAPSVLRPRVPVVGVTGTNGKTTTSRMISHIAMKAGRSVGWSSTEGVFLDGRLLDAGDWSGPGGARLVLSQPGVQLGVLETARGGILRRGIGVTGYDVAVVTNISADHLGVDGIETLDQLAEAKSVVPQIARRWAVLNADDPRVWPMRHTTAARPWAFSVDPDSPHVREALVEDGRATVVLDGCLTVLALEADPVPVVDVADVPMTLVGLSRANVENALAAASAALALGFTLDAVAAGLRDFRPDRDSDGRMNVFSLGDITVIVDMAHNEASFAAVLEIAHGLRRPGGRVLLGIGCSGDRSEDSIVRMGEIAGLGAQGSVIKPPLGYLRGRTAGSLVELMAEGLARAGQEPLGVELDELGCLTRLLDAAGPGDVVVQMTHDDRDLVKQRLAGLGATPDDPATLRHKVERATA